MAGNNFCDQCGRRVDPNSKFCAGCGKPFFTIKTGPAPPPTQPQQHYLQVPQAQPTQYSEPHLQPVPTPHKPKWFHYILGIVGVIGLFWVVVLFSDNDSNIDSTQQLSPEEKAAVAEIGEKPENSDWDGAVEPVTDFLKSHLKDPYSVKYEEWSPVELYEYEGMQYWAVRCKYRAKNSFGAYNLYHQVFLIQDDQVWEVIPYIDYE